MCATDMRSRVDDADQSQDIGATDEPSSPINSTQLEPRGQSFGTSPSNLGAKITMASPKTKGDNSRYEY